MTMTRHMAIKKEIGSRLMVVMMSLPEKPDQALVVEVDGLPDLVRDELLELVQSKEAQDCMSLADVLVKKTLRSGDLAISALQFLHNRGYLKPIATNHVIMTPTPQNHMLLSEINDAVNGTTTTEKKDTVGQELSEHTAEKCTSTPTLCAADLHKKANEMMDMAKAMLELANNMKGTEDKEAQPNIKGIKKTRGRPRIH